jgi:2-polyprenyl-3-methyl-5-hydroxy-6-metoxy-1,4-benzoquinol methylase
MKNSLDKIAEKYSEEMGYEKTITDYKIREILRFTKGDTVLDLGCGKGLITRELAKVHKTVIGVDGSGDKIDEARKVNKQNNIEYVTSWFDDYIPTHKINSVVISNVLEHLEDPVALLKRVYTWLGSKGRVVSTVPNSNSLNRKLGLKMGVIKTLKSLTPEDVGKGHVRVYDKDQLAADYKKAGFEIYHIGGIFFKPFPHKMMIKVATPQLNEALYELREEFSDICSALIIVGVKK